MYAPSHPHAFLRLIRPSSKAAPLPPPHQLQRRHALHQLGGATAPLQPLRRLLQPLSAHLLDPSRPLSSAPPCLPTGSRSLTCCVAVGLLPLPLPLQALLPRAAPARSALHFQQAGSKSWRRCARAAVQAARPRPPRPHPLPCSAPPHPPTGAPRWRVRVGRTPAATRARARRRSAVEAPRRQPCASEASCALRLPAAASLRPRSARRCPPTVSPHRSPPMTHSTGPHTHIRRHLPLLHLLVRTPDLARKIRGAFASP